MSAFKPPGISCYSQKVARLALLSSMAAVLVLNLAPLPSCAESAADMAKRIYNSYDVDEVMFPLRQALKENPNDPELHYLMGFMYMRTGVKLRGQKELELSLKLAPDHGDAASARQLLDSWAKEQLEKGQKYSWSNRDYWFDQYYRNHEYHSTDEDAAPEWTKKHDADREWKVDVHFIGGNYKVPGGGTAAHYADPWVHGFMRTFHDAWENKAKSAQVIGSADLYCSIDHDGIMHAVIARLDGGEPFKRCLLETIAGLNSSQPLLQAGASKPCFKARIASRHALWNSGTWYAFGTAGTKRVPVRVSLVGTFEPKSSTNVSGIMLMKSPAQPTPADPPQALSLRAKVEPKHDSVLQQARSAFDRGEFNHVYDLLWPLVESNDADACLLMGRALSSADNQHPQPRIAELFYEKAVRLGNKDAIAVLADGAEFGNARIDMDEAVTMLKEAADAGSSICQFNLGRLYEFGDSVEQSNKNAVHYYTLAARAGNSDAIEGLKRLKGEPAAKGTNPR